MSLVPDYSGSSESNSELDDDSSSEESFSPSEQTIVSNINTEKLPKPDFVGNVSTNSGQSSVFKNPFKDAENAKQAILEKHVKMVNAKENVRTINGKKICWNYRKGKCRFGHNCIYAHDSDIQKSREQLEAENQLQQTVLCQNQLLPQPSTHELKQIKDEAINANKRKNRPGLTQGLVPGKKVMKKFKQQQVKTTNGSKQQS